jgi:hypothetical protein
MIALVGGVIAVVLLGFMATVGVDVPGGSDDRAQRATARTSTSQPATTTSPSTEPGYGHREQGTAGPNVVLSAFGGNDFPSAPTVLDQLPPSAVLRITARGFEPNDIGIVEQCAGSVCTNGFPVTFGALGIAHFQYLLRDGVDTTETERSTCRANASPCVIRVRTDSHTTYARTVVRDTAPPPRQVTTVPALHDVNDGQAITVSVRNFVPGEQLQAVLCAAPETVGSLRCGAPGPVARFVVGPDGRGSTKLVVRRGAVGSERLACGRAVTCGVVVPSEASMVPAPVAVIDFSSGPSAHYDGTRVALGLLIALVLLAGAFALVRSTDWRKPTEADTPDLDAAALADP